MYKLLIVDDEKMIRMGIKNAIDWEMLGIGKVCTAASAREALAVMEKEEPQIVLTDISMAEMSGLDLIEEIRSRHNEKKIRILVLTGYDRFEYARRCLQMRVQNFLLKPVDEEELKASVQEQVQILEQIRVMQEEAHAVLRTEGARRQAEVEKYMGDLVHRRLGEKSLGCPNELMAVSGRTMEIAILLPEAKPGRDKETEGDFRQLTMKNICMDLLDARHAGITFSDDDGKIVLAVFTSDTEQNITECMGELRGILENECGIRSRVVLGSEAEGFEMLPASYEDASGLLAQDIRGTQEIVTSGQERDKEQLAQEICREFKQSMTANIADGNRVMDIYGKFCQAVKTYNLSRAQVQKWCFDIASGIYFVCVMETGEQVDNRMESLIKALTGAGREEALEVTELFIRRLVLQGEAEQHEVVSSARRYIDEHLESELSVSKLAEQFYLSTNYFSRLFKKVMDEGCSEYIIRKRIEKSRVLLETTAIKTGKIAMMVGYNDTNYFSIAFKKHTGMSPTRYREKLQKKRAEEISPAHCDSL